MNVKPELFSIANVLHRIKFDGKPASAVPCVHMRFAILVSSDLFQIYQCI